MLEQELDKLGFSKNEASVYLALFDSGKTRARTIIELTGLHRNLVYGALDALQQRGLITKVNIGGVATFSANDPASLLEGIQAQQSIAQQVIQTLQKRKHSEEYEVQVYEGTEGMKRARNKTLLEADAAGQTLYVMGGSKFSTVPELESYWRQYHRDREKRGINFKILFDNNTDPEMLRWRNKLPLSEAKYLPYNFENPLQVSIFKSLVDISMPGSSPLTFSIRSAEIADGFKKYFDYFWNQKVAVEYGVEALEKNIYHMLNELAPGESYNVLGASAGGYNDTIQKLYDRFHADRIKKGVVVNMLVYKESYERIKKRFSEGGDPEGKISHLRSFIDAPPTPMQINIYNKKVIIILYSDEPVVIHFDEPALFEGFQAYFEQMWQQEIQLLYGAEKLCEFWLESMDYPELRYIGAHGYMIDNYPELYAKIEVAAKKKKVVWRNVMNPNFRGHPITKIPWMRTRYTLLEAPQPNVVWLYGNKMVMVNWTENEPALFVTTNEKIVASYNAYFDRLWNQTALTLPNAVGLRELYERILETSEPVCCLGDYALSDLLPGVQYDIFEKQRIKQSIHFYILTSRKIETPFLSTVKHVKAEKLPPYTTFIFGNCVAQITSGQNPSVFFLENSEAAKQYRAYFERMKKI